MVRRNSIAILNKSGTIVLKSDDEMAAREDFNLNFKKLVDTLIKFHEYL